MGDRSYQDNTFRWRLPQAGRCQSPRRSVRSWKNHLRFVARLLDGEAMTDLCREFNPADRLARRLRGIASRSDAPKPRQSVLDTLGIQRGRRHRKRCEAGLAPKFSCARACGIVLAGRPCDATMGSGPQLPPDNRRRRAASVAGRSLLA